VLDSSNQKSRQIPLAAPDPAPVPAPAAPIGSRVTRSQGKVSTEALTASATDSFTYAEAIESPQRDHWKIAMEEESTSILLDNTFSALNSREALQLRVKPIGSKWVYKTKHNPDRSTWYKARLVIKSYEHTDFGETYAPCWEANYVSVSHLSHWEIWMEYGPLGCSYHLPKSQNRRRQYLYDSTRRMARRSQRPQNHRQTQESSLRP
jgi:hypothetical protein